MSYSIIIPSRNIANLTKCVSTLRGMGETCRVIVVDDGIEGDYNDGFLFGVSFHWFFLVQPSPFPETLIANNVEFYLKYMMFRDMSSTKIPTWMGEDAFAEYLRCLRDPATVHANCEDYRAGASIDMEHDEEDLKRKILCPVLVLWGGRGAVHRLFDTLSVWRERAANVSGKPLPGRHFLPEEIPDETLAALRTFLNT